MRNYVGRAFIPQLNMTFHELGLDESILKSIDEFGFKEPTPIPVSYTHLTLPTKQPV